MQTFSLTLWQRGCRALMRVLVVVCLASLGSLAVTGLRVALKGEEPSGLRWLTTQIKNDYQAVVTIAPTPLRVRLDRMLARIPNRFEPDPPSIVLPMIDAQRMHALWYQFLPWIQIALLGVKQLIIRAVCVVPWFFLLLLLGTVGWVDGITERAIRRHCIGPESAFGYHAGKGCVQLSILSGLVVILAAPLSVPSILTALTALAVCVAVALQVMIKHIKKYL